MPEMELASWRIKDPARRKRLMPYPDAASIRVVRELKASTHSEQRVSDSDRCRNQPRMMLMCCAEYEVKSLTLRIKRHILDISPKLREYRRMHILSGAAIENDIIQIIILEEQSRRGE